MIIKVDGIEQTLVQVTDSVTGVNRGLYFVPKHICVETFEYELKKSGSQVNFDENNDIGVQRVYAYESLLDLEF